MATLTAAQRNKLPDSAFALPGRKYPIPDIEHARNALARVEQHGTEEEKKKVRAAVYRKYPSLKPSAQKFEEGGGWSGMFAPNVKPSV